MPRLPQRPNLEYLKKQAKELLRLYEAGDAAAFARFRNFLPAAEGKEDAAIAALGLKLHDAQSCVAREYGLPSWRDLRNYVEGAHSRSQSIVCRSRIWAALLARFAELCRGGAQQVSISKRCDALLAALCLWPWE
jgi:hypothetical protein